MAKIKRNKLIRFLEYKILHIEDTPHKISLGVALGLFIAWSPLLGLHFLQIIVRRCAWPLYRMVASARIAFFADYCFEYPAACQ
jgi:uncharacterized protein (DUF2062 family)